MTLRNIFEARARLFALLDAVQAGEELIIGKAGPALARQARYPRAATLRRPGALKGRIRIADNFEELPADIAEPFGLG